MFDRIDIHVEVPNVRYKNLTSDATCKSSEGIREEVTKARETQLKGPQRIKYSTNTLTRTSRNYNIEELRD